MPERHRKPVKTGVSRMETTKINDLKSFEAFEAIEGVLSGLSEPREVQTKEGPTKVQEGLLQDASGEVRVSFWGEQVTRFALGDKVRLVKGWVSARKGNRMVSTGFRGDAFRVLE